MLIVVLLSLLSYCKLEFYGIYDITFSIYPLYVYIELSSFYLFNARLYILDYFVIQEYFLRSLEY